MPTKEKKEKEKNVASKKEKEITPHWQKLVKIFFDFCNDKKGDDPSFGGMETRNMKELVKELQRRAEKREIVWTEDVAASRWKNFLEYAYSEQWLSANWTLFNLNRQKDKVFYKIAEQSKLSVNGQQSINQSNRSSASGKRDEQTTTVNDLFGEITKHINKSTERVPSDTSS